MAKYRILTGTGVAAAMALLAACTVHKTEAPPLTGPSELATSISVQVTPDVLTQDGASQSLVTITARNANGQPIANLPLRTEIIVNGVIADFGTLSAHNVVTDSSGRATVTFTAPPAPAASVDTGTVVQIGVVPVGTNFANESVHTVDIRLVPPGTVVPPLKGTATFVVSPSSPGQGDKTTFTGKVVDANGNDISSQLSFAWNFGDGGTATGQSVTHAFSTQGTFLVTMSATALGQSVSSSQSVTVGPPTSITPTFFTTPASPVSGQAITFNASQTTPPAGHTISGFFWDFGDGSDLATGAVVTHTFASPGTYTVLLRVTLDNGAQGTTSQTMTIAPPNPHAVINLSPPTGTVGQTITFLGNKSTAAPGRTLVTYTWNFGDGSPVVSGSQSVVTHAYGSANTFTITLLVTDDQGNQDLATAQITIK